MNTWETHEYDDDDNEESFFCKGCGNQISQITYVNGDVCNECENKAYE